MHFLAFPLALAVIAFKFKFFLQAACQQQENTFLIAIRKAFCDVIFADLAQPIGDRNLNVPALSHNSASATQANTGAADHKVCHGNMEEENQYR
jgi:hypothetical protein